MQVIGVLRIVVGALSEPVNLEPRREAAPGREV